MSFILKYNNYTKIERDYINDNQKVDWSNREIKILTNSISSFIDINKTYTIKYSGKYYNVPSIYLSDSTGIPISEKIKIPIYKNHTTSPIVSIPNKNFTIFIYKYEDYRYLILSKVNYSILVGLYDKTHYKKFLCDGIPGIVECLKNEYSTIIN